MFESNENYNNNVYVQEKEVCDSIANSFDAIVNVIRQYKNDVSKTDNLKTNEISVQDTVNFGINADTFLTNVHVNGLKHFDSQNFTMVWGEDLVSVLIKIFTVVLDLFIGNSNEIILLVKLDSTQFFVVDIFFILQIQQS